VRSFSGYLAPFQSLSLSFLSHAAPRHHESQTSRRSRKITWSTKLQVVCRVACHVVLHREPKAWSAREGEHPPPPRCMNRSGSRIFWRPTSSTSRADQEDPRSQSLGSHLGVSRLLLLRAAHSTTPKEGHIRV
jgi:hypothetical protein